MAFNLEYMRKFALTTTRQNEDFSKYLRDGGISREEIDGIVAELYLDCVQKIDCTQCANCCKNASPHLDREDVRRIARRLHCTQADFKRLFLVKDVDFGDYGFTKKPCPMLKNNRCIVYPDHPQECRQYPHLDKFGFVARLTNIMENYPICPIIFEVIERLKAEIWQKSKDLQ